WRGGPASDRPARPQHEGAGCWRAPATPRRSISARRSNREVASQARAAPTSLPADAAVLVVQRRGRRSEPRTKLRRIAGQPLDAATPRGAGGSAPRPPERATDETQEDRGAAVGCRNPRFRVG